MHKQQLRFNGNRHPPACRNAALCTDASTTRIGTGHPHRCEDTWHVRDAGATAGAVGAHLDDRIHHQILLPPCHWARGGRMSRGVLVGLNQQPCHCTPEIHISIKHHFHILPNMGHTCTSMQIQLCCAPTKNGGESPSGLCAICIVTKAL